MVEIDFKSNKFSVFVIRRFDPVTEDFDGNIMDVSPLYVPTILRTLLKVLPCTGTYSS